MKWRLIDSPASMDIDGMDGDAVMKVRYQRQENVFFGRQLRVRGLQACLAISINIFVNI